MDPNPRIPPSKELGEREERNAAQGWAWGSGAGPGGRQGQATRGESPGAWAPRSPDPATPLPSVVRALGNVLPRPRPLPALIILFILILVEFPFLIIRVIKVHCKNKATCKRKK